MSHTPFILGSYAVATVVLLWCAISPLIRQRAEKARLKIKLKQMEKRHDAHS